MRVLIEHIPHIVVAIVMFGVGLWLWLENVRSPPEEEGEEAVRIWIDERHSYSRRRVQRTVAGPALLLLAVIVAATATGAWLFAINLASASRTTLIVAAHCAAGVMVLALFWHKQRRSGKGRLMSAIRHGRALDVASSLSSLVFLIALTITGILALFFPRAGGISVDLHLLLAVSFTLLLGLHLRQYLLGTVRAWRARRTAAPATEPAPAPTPITLSTNDRSGATGEVHADAHAI